MIGFGVAFPVLVLVVVLVGMIALVERFIRRAAEHEVWSNLHPLHGAHDWRHPDCSFCWKLPPWPAAKESPDVPHPDDPPPFA